MVTTPVQHTVRCTELAPTRVSNDLDLLRINLQTATQRRMKDGIEKNMKLKLIFVSTAIALAQVAPLNAQSVSPEDRYTKKAGGAGQMRVQKTGEDWRI